MRSKLCIYSVYEMYDVYVVYDGLPYGPFTSIVLLVFDDRLVLAIVGISILNDRMNPLDYLIVALN